MITAQDDFVATLLQDRAELQQRLVEAQQHASAIKDKASSAREEQERLAGIRQLETQVTQAREVRSSSARLLETKADAPTQTYQEHLKAQEEAEKTLANLDAQLAQLKLHASSTQPVESLKTGVRAKADRSPPLVLVLINGCVSPCDVSPPRALADAMPASLVQHDRAVLGRAHPEGHGGRQGGVLSFAVRPLAYTLCRDDAR